MTLDPKSPVPLFHQIAERLRYAIESGQLAPGQQLATLRDAAEQWGVHLHTVRHAYAELVRDGLLVTQGRAGTRVAAPPSIAAPGRLAAAANDDEEARRGGRSFLESFANTAQRRFGWPPERLLSELRQHLESATPPVHQVHVLECSQAQAHDLALQIGEGWRVEAVAHCLEDLVDLPEGEVVATYFHYNEVRRRWPLRLHQTHFLSMAPDDRLRDLILKRTGTVPDEIDIAELDLPTAEAVAADVSATLDSWPSKVRPLAVSTRAALPTATAQHPVLFPPRIGARFGLDPTSNPFYLPIRYLLDAAELSALAGVLGWTKTRGAHQ